MYSVLQKKHFELEETYFELKASNSELQEIHSELEETYHQLHGSNIELKVSNSELQERFRSTKEEVSCICGISPLALNDVFGGITIFPFEQFELFKTKHASCDVTKVGAGGIFTGEREVNCYVPL